MSSTVWDRLWQMHDETKALVLFRPREIFKQFKSDHVFENRAIDDSPSVERLDEAPAEHNQRLKTGPDGVKEEEPREYTTRQKVGLALGRFYFF